MKVSMSAALETTDDFSFIILWATGGAMLTSFKLFIFVLKLVIWEQGDFNIERMLSLSP
jgi:hypothetical protein